MPYKPDDFDEISRELNELVEAADIDGGFNAEIDLSDASRVISKYSPDSSILKKAIKANKFFCYYCGIETKGEMLDIMDGISKFVKDNHAAFSSTSFKPQFYDLLLIAALNLVGKDNLMPQNPIIFDL